MVYAEIDYGLNSQQMVIIDESARFTADFRASRRNNFKT